jgi:hypothetical protein
MGIQSCPWNSFSHSPYRIIWEKGGPEMEPRRISYGCVSSVFGTAAEAVVALSQVQTLCVSFPRHLVGKEPDLPSPFSLLCSSLSNLLFIHLKRQKLLPHASG